MIAQILNLLLLVFGFFFTFPLIWEFFALLFAFNNALSGKL